MTGSDANVICSSPVLVGYYTDDGKLIYAGRVGTGMPVKVLADLRRRLDPPGPQNIASERPAAALHPLRIATRSVSRALGRAEACRRDHLLTWTADNLLRHTVYVRPREDKSADQVRRENPRV
jgi:ATP-dependent DNA ligase